MQLVARAVLSARYAWRIRQGLAAFARGWQWKQVLDARFPVDLTCRFLIWHAALEKKMSLVRMQAAAHISESGVPSRSETRCARAEVSDAVASATVAGNLPVRWYCA